MRGATVFHPEVTPEEIKDRENEKKRQERKVKEAEMQERAKNKLEEERKALKRRVYVQENGDKNTRI